MDKDRPRALSSQGTGPIVQVWRVKDSNLGRQCRRFYRAAHTPPVTCYFVLHIRNFGTYLAQSGAQKLCRRLALSTLARPRRHSIQCVSEHLSASLGGIVCQMDIVRAAAGLAEELVSPLGRRWTHVQAVAARAAELTPASALQERPTLLAAAWLHDIGYSPAIADTGLHPLDGARHLLAEGWPPSVVNLVAHHSAARYEAAERGLSHELAEFPFEVSALQDALDTADLTTGPDGRPLTFDERMDEIMQRYPADHLVHRFWLVARPVEAEAVRRTEARLTATQSTTG